jgi:hypothetical protein
MSHSLGNCWSHHKGAAGRRNAVSGASCWNMLLVVCSDSRPRSLLLSGHSSSDGGSAAELHDIMHMRLQLMHNT